ncbi:MAG: SMC family ATPase [Draconibacterium sp.]|nr:SMC family ATPase [Draconibacterium sp.]
MIPIKLTIQGLYSYQKKQTIDFTKLTAARLFGIFGTVGSGKSSILEAITFALYGKTDRLNQKGDNRNYNMMNLKSNELLIDFTFETGKEQTAYRAVVKGRRNSKNFDDVNKFDRITYKYEGESWFPIEPTILENAIGLSYQNFKRTIIIPQGQFQEFLQLGNTDRTKMMKELFNLEKFELYYKVVALESKNNEKKQNIQGQLQQLGEIDPQQIATFEEQLIQIEKELGELNENLKTKQTQETQWQQVRDLVEKFKTSKNLFEQLQKQQLGFVQLENKVQQYEKCVFQFKNILDALDTSNKKIVTKTKQIKTDSQKLEKEEAEILAKETVLNDIKPAFETRELLKQRAEELGKLSKIKSLDTNIEKGKERLSKGNDFLDRTVNSIERLKTDEGDLLKWIKAEKANLPDLALLSKVKTWYVEKNILDKQAVEIDTELVNVKQEESKILGAIQSILNNSIFNDLPEKTGYLIVVKFLQEKIETIKTKLKSLEKEADHFRVKVQLEKFAGNLNDGKPCPLCGSLHHPAIYSAVSIREEQNRLEKRKRILEVEIEQINKTILQLKELENQLNFNSKILNDWGKKQEENVKKTKKHISFFEWPQYKNQQDVENAFNAAGHIQKEIKIKETELDKLSVKLEKEIKNKEQFQVEINKINTEVTIHQTETKTLQDQLKIVSIGEYSNRSTSEIETEKNALLQRYLQLEKQYSELNKQLANLRTSKDRLSGSLTTKKQEFELEQKENSTLLEQLEAQLKQTDYSTIDEVKQILAQPIELEKQKQLLADFKQNLALAKNRLEELQKELGSRVYDFEAHQKLLGEISSFKETVTQKNQEEGRVSLLLKNLQKNLKDQLALQKTLESLELRAENIRTLKSLFKASGFVNYISSVYLQNLCNAANDRFFQLTRQKLSLEITEDNNFEVRDFMNGGKVRNVKTLSGGQTFQAALSLALALADNIQKITESNQNFFFLDEGFGSLDKEALSVVFDTLKSLRKENRIVGVISHVEEMQQEIEVHLRIENDEEKGSEIYRSWAG